MLFSFHHFDGHPADKPVAELHAPLDTLRLTAC
jgi:hypothetical protein